MNTQYSELVGSFIRTGDFPLEANYVFSTEADLREFCSNKLNVTTLHKGLFKIVEKDEDDKQALYWVTPKEDSEELEFTKLISFDDIESLKEGLNKLSKDLKDYPTRAEVTEQIATIVTGGEIDLSGYATTSYVNAIDERLDKKIDELLKWYEG